MNDKGLDIRFQEAFERLSQSQQDFAPDILLTFFALYKRANQNNSINSDSDSHELISAFKMNAILQLKDMSSDEAKQAYIEAVANYLK